MMSYGRYSLRVIDAMLRVRTMGLILHGVFDPFFVRAEIGVYVRNALGARSSSRHHAGDLVVVNHAATAVTL